MIFCRYYNSEWWQWIMSPIEIEHKIHLREINDKHYIKLLFLKNERKKPVNVIDKSSGSIHIIGDNFTMLPMRKRPHRRGLKKTFI